VSGGQARDAHSDRALESADSVDRCFIQMVTSHRLRGVGIEPALAKAKRNFENGNGKPCRSSSEGWRHVPSADSMACWRWCRRFHLAPLTAMVRSSSNA
jgi:hypothetical protein